MPGYREWAKGYFERGWSPLPLPDGLKKPPPTGWTGLAAPYPSVADIEAWIETVGEANIGLRLPFTVIGIDVDCYDGKPGAREFARLIEEFGPLPRAMRSTSRDDGISGIRFYRVPSDWRPVRRMPDGIDLIWAGHRYAVVWPSRHPLGNVYRWLYEDGGRAPDPPYLEDVPDLPRPWLDGLGRSEPSRGEAAEHEQSAPWVEQRSRWDVERVESGRHNWLASYAGHVAALGVSRFEAVGLVEAMADRCVPGRGKTAASLRSEARRALDDFLRAEHARPREAEPEPTDWSFMPAEDVMPERVSTLWDGFLIVGALNVLTAEEGCGKSILAASLAAMAARGELSEDGEPVGTLIVGGEDSIRAVWRPRLEAAGLVPGRILFEPMKANPLTGEPDPAQLYKPEVLESLFAHLGERAGPMLVYLDHLSAVIPPGRKSQDYDEIGAVLRPINKLAERYGHCVLGAWHLNKGGGSVRDRSMNSTAIRASVRQQLVLVERGDDHARIVAIAKSGAGDLNVPARGFVIRPASVTIAGEPYESSTIGPITEMDHRGSGLDYVESILRANAKREPKGERRSPDAWLRDYLARNGPSERRKVLAFGEVEGFGRVALEGAAERIGVIRSRQPGRHGTPALWVGPVSVP